MKMLEWKKYDSTSSSAFKNLYEDTLLTDVTLACEGQQKVEGHRVILSACSNFFKEILQENPHPHPLIFLQGIDFHNLVLLKKFMYLGKAQIAHENIKTFIKISGNLLNTETTENTKITREETKGGQESVETSVKCISEPIHFGELINSASKEDLVQSKCIDKDNKLVRGNFPTNLSNPANLDPMVINTSTASSTSKKDISPIEFIAKVKMSCLQCKYKTFDSAKLTDHIDKHHSEKLCPKCGISIEVGKLSNHLRYKHSTYSCDDCNFTTENYDKSSFHQKIHNIDSLLRCDKCEFTSFGSNHLRKHREIHNPSDAFKCKECDFTAKTRIQVRYHNGKVHKGLRYECSSCDYSATMRNNLKIHEISVHSKLRSFCRFCTFSNSLRSRVKLHEKRKHSLKLDKSIDDPSMSNTNQ